MDTRTKFGEGGRQPFTVFIEGNIGSGKTTFLNHFQKYEDSVCLLTEPVERWRNLNGTNLLNAFYKEPFRWAMPFQTYVTLTMMERHTQVPGGLILPTEDHRNRPSISSTDD